MNPTPLAHLLATLSRDPVLVGVILRGAASVYTVRGGVIYHHRATDTGHGFMVPEGSDRAAWARMAHTCAFTAPANPQTMHLGAAGERLGAFWRSLPDPAAERRVLVPDLLAVLAVTA